MTTFLIGGGWSPEHADELYGPLLADTGRDAPTVACLVVDEGNGWEQFSRWAGVLDKAGPCDPAPVLVPLGGALDVAALGEADALLVCGGLTPAYADVLAPVADQVRSWLAEGGRPYAGFSAGASVASERALVGGWLLGSVPVCPDDAAEDLEEITTVDGLGLVPFTIDVHCAQWGTLPRLVAAIDRGDARCGVALDEDTMLAYDGTTGTVHGAGYARVLRKADDHVEVRLLRAGEGIYLG